MKITVYLGSSFGNDKCYGEACRKLGTWIGSNGYTLVYGGAAVGTMGILADSVLETGGKVTGIMPRFMINGKKNHTHLNTFIVTEDMSERKKKMMELGDAFIAMPGGPGTLEEIPEVISASRLHLIDKPVFLLNLNHYYDPLKKQMDHMHQAGFLNEDECRDVYFESTLEDIENRLQTLWKEK